MKEFTFETGVIVRVQVQAADEASARQVVPSVIAAPASMEIALANECNRSVGREAVVTAVDFIGDGKVKRLR